MKRGSDKVVEVTSSAAEQTGSRRFPRKRYWLPLLLLVAAYLLQPVNRMRELRNASRGADAVRIVLYVPKPSEQRVVTVHGAEMVADFLEQVSLTPGVLSCMCQGMTELQFVRGDEVLVRLNFAGEKLLWKGGKWHSDGFITSASSDRIHAWIDVKGGAELSSAKAEVKKLWDDWRAEMERDASESQPVDPPPDLPMEEDSDLVVPGLGGS